MPVDAVVAPLLFIEYPAFPAAHYVLREFGEVCREIGLVQDIACTVVVSNCNGCDPCFIVNVKHFAQQSSDTLSKQGHSLVFCVPCG